MKERHTLKCHYHPELHRSILDIKNSCTLVNSFGCFGPALPGPARPGCRGRDLSVQLDSAWLARPEPRQALLGLQIGLIYIECNAAAPQPRLPELEPLTAAVNRK